MSLTNLSDTQRETLKLTTLEYSIADTGSFLSEPIIELFARDADGNRRMVEVEGFYPFFFISEAEYKKNEADIFTESMVRHVYAREGITSDENKHNASLEELPSAPRETLLDEKLVKIETVIPKHVATMADYFDETWEADIFFTNRFLIDSGISLYFSIPEGEDRVSYDEILSEDDGPSILPRMVTIDIEVWTGGTFPDVSAAEKPITAVTLYDSYDDRYVAGILHPESTDVADSYSWADVAWQLPDGVDTANIAVFRDEATMLGAANTWMIRKDPDLLSGWNSSKNKIGNGFDYPYWINRCIEINEWTIRDLSYDNGSSFVSDYGSPSVGGREMFDMLQAYRKTQIHEKRSYALDYIAQEELGRGKEDIDGLDEAWLHEPSDFMKYNIRDVSAVVEIEDVKNVLSMYDHIRSISGATYSAINESNIGLIDMQFLREADSRNIALPTSTEPDVQHYWGAYVFYPVPGKHRNVVYPDLKCFTPEHDILTPDGVKQITDISTGDSVYSLDPEDGAIEVKEVVETYAYPEYDGETVTFEGTRVNFEVTPNHRMIYESSDGYYFEEADAFDEKRRVLPNPSDGIDGPGIETFDMTEYMETDWYDVRATYEEHGHAYRSKLPDGCQKKRANYHEGFFFGGETFQSYKGDIESLSESVELAHPNGGGSTFRPYKFDGDTFIELLGWFITEGSTYWPDEQETAVVKVAQEKYGEAVRDCFERLGTTYSEINGAFTIGSAMYANFFDEYCGKCSSEKCIPEFVFSDASLEQKELLLETMMKGDGYENIYYTSSEELADDVLRLATECGKKVKKNKRRSNDYEIHITETNDGITDSMHGRSTAENGVYCIEVKDNNTMLAGRDGKFQWVGNSLYPELFRDMNVSPETIIGDETALRESEYSKDDCHTIYVDERDEDVKKEADEPERKTLYVLKPAVKESFVREIVQDLIDMKYEYKKPEYGAEAYAAVKRITNSVYGVMGDSISYGTGFRLFDWRIAEAITLAGRDVIKHTADEFESRVQSQGYPDAEIISGDTDSCVCEIPTADDMEETLDVAQEAANYVDSTYDEFMEERFNMEKNNMSVEIESYAKTALLMDKKKRYAQWIKWDEGESVDTVEVKGFELVRSDSALITEEVQREVIERILKEPSPRDAVESYLKEWWDAVTDGDIDIEQIGRPSQINNKLWEYGYSEQDDGTYLSYTPQPHIRGARYANAFIDGESNVQSEKPLMFYCDGVDESADVPETYCYDNQLCDDAPGIEMMEEGNIVDAISVTDCGNVPDGIHIDYEKISEKVLRDPIEPILTVMGWSFDEFIMDGSQRSLDKYM